MSSRLYRLAAVPLLAVVAVGLTGCVNAEPAAVESLRVGVDSFEERLERVMWSRPKPAALLRLLTVDNDSDFSGTIVDDEVGADALTLKLFWAAEATDGGAIFNDEVYRYACITYEIDPHEQSYTRVDSDCSGLPKPNQPTPGVAEQTTVEELGLEPTSGS